MRLISQYSGRDARLGPHAILITTARGGVVEEDGLVAALKTAT